MSERAGRGGGSLSDADLRLLEARARVLAKRHKPTGGGDLLDVVVFAVRGETFALELRHLRQVLVVKELALLPGVAPPLVALTSWRGQLLAVFDLALLLGRSATGASDRRHLLVIGERAPLALLVDEIIEMTVIQTSAVAAMPREDAAVIGATKEAVLVLDGTQLLRTLDREAS